MTDLNEFPSSSIQEENELNEEVSIPVENIEDTASTENNSPKINTVRPESKSKSVYVSNETHHLYKAPLSQQLLRLLVKRTGSKFNHFDFNSNVKEELQKKLTRPVQKIVPSCTVVFDTNPDMIVQDENGDRLCGVQWIYFNREDQCDPKKWYVDLVFMKYSNDTYYDELVYSIKSFFERLEQANHNTKNMVNNRSNNPNMMNNRNRNTNKNNKRINNGNGMNNRIRGGKRKKTQKKRRLHRRS